MWLLLGSLLVSAGFDRQDLVVPGSLLSVTTGDLDGDGATDLIASYRRGAGPQAERYLAVFFRGPAGYGNKPDCAFLAPKNAVVFDVADAIGDARQELIYLTATGIYVQPFAGRKPGTATQIVPVSTLVMTPEEDELGHWDFVRSVGEQQIMVLPTRKGVALHRREGALWKLWSHPSVEQLSYYDAESRAYRRSPRGGSSGRPYAFRVTIIVPNLDLVDQTGDGRTDLVAHFEDRVAVFAQAEDGTLPETPTWSRWFMARSADELETRDVGVDATVLDLDGDGIADLALTKIGGGITTLKTEVRFYRGKKGGGFDDQPAQILSDSGFAALSGYADVDGDGRLEMIHPHSEVSIMAMSRAMLSSKIAIDVRIRGKGEGQEFFSRKPKQVLESHLGLDFTVGATLRGAAPIFGHDLDGDGLRDAIISGGGDAMRIHRGQKAGLEEDGHITLQVAGSNTTQLLAPQADGGGLSDVLVYYVARRDQAGRIVVFKNRGPG